MATGNRAKRRWRWGAKCAATLCALLVCVATRIGSEPAAAAKLDIVVPAYFYPSGGSDWPKLNAAAAKVPLTAIMNPGNGPGNNVDSNYTSVVNSLRAAGGHVIGYVYSSYTQRSLQVVLNDVDKYDALYNVDGIFVDEMLNTGPAEKLDYYKAIYDHVKAIDPTWQVMGNPGTNTLEPYLTWPTADRLMVFENVGSAYPGHTVSPWNYNYDRSRFVHLVHTEPSSANMLADLQRAIANNAGGIYVTDDVLNNPWDRVPTYWNALVEAVAAINADYNSDGMVDAGDYSVWRDSVGLTGVSLAADGNGDGVVDDKDYTHWRNYFGASAGGGAGGAATMRGVAAPEPASVGLVVLALTVSSLACRPSREFAQG
ncbi:MAG: spherulation-specific family 4 protein [Pirellulales bacterium]